MMPRTFHRALWRLSIAVAAGLIGLALWLGYEMAQAIRLLSALTQALGGEGEIYWGNIALVFGLIAAVGVILPITYIGWAWPHAFRSTR